MTHPINEGWTESATSIFNNDVLAERHRQLRKWGPQSHPDGTGDLDRPLLYGTDSNLDLRTPRELANIFRSFCDRKHSRGEGTWLQILLEEVFEASAEDGGEPLREELVQCAAVIFAWIEDLDRRQFARVAVRLPVPELETAA